MTNSNQPFSTISIAPMLDWTDHHYRYFMRQISQKSVLYTEMIVADAIIHGNRDSLLGFAEEEQPLVVQLGGSDPKKLAQASKICQDFGYKEINLNLGCPSDRVKSGMFGACLMLKPQLVVDCIKAIEDTVALPISIKHRLGIDDINEFNFVNDFVAHIAHNTKCTHYIVHARNAILSGLSPKQNREIPPLKYDYVYRLKQTFPDLYFTINGGIKTIPEITTNLSKVDGVMIGREAYHNPYLLAEVDNIISSNNKPIKSRLEVANAMLPYLEIAKNNDTPLHRITRHMLGLFHGCPNARLWRHTLASEIIKTNSLDTYLSALDLVTKQNTCE